MKLKKIFTTIILFSVGLTCVFAQKNDDFSRICKKLSVIENVRGNFQLEQYSSKTGRALKSSGNYTISGPDGIIWFTEIPVKSVMAVTKNYMYMEMNGKQRKMDGAGNQTFSNMANVISALFTGNYEQIIKDFEVSCSLMEGKSSVWNINLIPRDATIASYMKQIDIVAMEMPDKCHIAGISMFLYNGDHSVYQLKNQVVIDNLNDDEKRYFEK